MLLVNIKLILEVIPDYVCSLSVGIHQFTSLSSPSPLGRVSETYGI